MAAWCWRLPSLVIEVALIVPLMVAGGAEAAALARDTVFAAVMIILNGIICLCLLLGGLKHREQTFSLEGVSAALVALSAIVVLNAGIPRFYHYRGSLLLPKANLCLIAIVSLAIFGASVFAQTIAHRQIFLAQSRDDLPRHVNPPSNAMSSVSAVSCSSAWSGCSRGGRLRV